MATQEGPKPWTAAKRRRAENFLRRRLEIDEKLNRWEGSGLLEMMMQTAEKWFDNNIEIPAGLRNEPLKVFMMRFVQTVDIQRLHPMLAFTKSDWFKDARKEAMIRYPPKNS